jgi:hypothetical protein
MLSPYISVSILCLVLIVGILVYIVTRRPRVKIDDGNHRFLYALLVTALVVGLIFGGLHVWIVTT